MEEIVYEKIMQFLTELRCEDTDRDSKVETESYLMAKEKKREKEKQMMDSIKQLSIEEQQSIQTYLTAVNELVFEESQQAYFQGFVDCILALAGAGMLKPQKGLEEMIKVFK